MRAKSNNGGIVLKRDCAHSNFVEEESAIYYDHNIL
jgi:hypothetical protein